LRELPKEDELCGEPTSPAQVPKSGSDTASSYRG
jgi:hypothetical protein